MTEEKKMQVPRAVKNLAELKRLIVPGAELKITGHRYFPDIVGLVRVVTKVQTNGFYSVIKDQPDHEWSCFNGGKGGWSSFEKAGNYIFDGDSITVLNPRRTDGSVLFQFQMLEHEMAMAEGEPEESMEGPSDEGTMTMGGMSL